MRLTPAYLTAVATFYDMFSTTPKGRHDVYVCTNISCSLRGADAIYEAMLSAAGDDPDFHVTRFECLGACDIAPMASVDGEYVGPLEEADCARIVEDVKAGREVLPDKQLKKRPKAETYWQLMNLLFENIDDPGLATLDGYSQSGGYEMLRKALSMDPRTSCRRCSTRASAAAAGPASRWARRCPSSPGGRWTSTSSATPTSPSPARSRTAS